MSSFVRKLIVRVNLIQLCARVRLPAFAALLARALSHTINKKNQYTVLCIGRPIFDEDIEELARYGGTLNYLIVPKIVFISIFKEFVPQLLFSHADYHTIQGYEHEKLKCRKFFESFLAEFRKAVRVDAIVTANYNYSWQQELAVAARTLDIPFVVLFKEGISPLFAEGVSSQMAYDVMVEKYTNRYFIGDLLLVYNDRIKEAFFRLGIAGTDREKVTTVGIPRFDRYFHLDAQGDGIVFFSFDFEDKARHLNLTNDEFAGYLARTRDFHVEVMRYAAAHPEVRVVVKTKNNVKYLRYVERIAEEEGFTNLRNMTLTNQGNVFDLIKGAHAVIGYNSTALLEAFAARRLVMSADFRQGPVRDYFDEYPNLPNYVTTAEDIAAVMAQSGTGRPIGDPDLYALLHQRIHIPDGQASARTEAAIERAIHARRSV